MAWNGSADAFSGHSSKQPSNHAVDQAGGRKRFRLFLTALLVVVGLGGILIWWMSDSASDDVEAANRKRMIADRAKSVPRVQTVKTNLSARVKSRQTSAPTPGGSPSVTGAGTTNQSALIQSQPPPHKPIKPRYKSITEFTLAMFFSTKLGDPPPPLPPLPEHELERMEEIINRPTEIDPRDGPTMRERKQICDLAKEEFKKFIEAGGDDIEFFDYYRKKLNQYHKEWQKGQSRVESLYNAGLYDQATALAKEINDDFAERGIKAVELPDQP